MKTKLDKLREIFGSKLQENVRMAHYTTARVGGVVDGLLPVYTVDELAKAAQALWELELSFRILGSGANILVSDEGFHGVMVLNRAHNLKIRSNAVPPSVLAESGAIFGTVARQTALRGLSGLEWATSVPGTVGGAVYGNAGAHGSDIAHDLEMATILHPNKGIEALSADEMGYQYRSSVFKREGIPAVIPSAVFKLQPSTREEAWQKITAFSEKRLASQPPGASTGSTFKNPEGDYAGRLIEAAGLKGSQAGQAQISPVHANFIVNEGGATAQDYYKLIRLAQARVKEKFGVQLELEIELLGEFKDEQ